MVILKPCEGMVFWSSWSLVKVCYFGYHHFMYDISSWAWSTFTLFNGSLGGLLCKAWKKSVIVVSFVYFYDPLFLVIHLTLVFQDWGWSHRGLVWEVSSPWLCFFYCTLLHWKPWLKVGKIKREKVLVHISQSVVYNSMGIVKEILLIIFLG